MSLSQRTAMEPMVLRATRGLISYLRDMVQASRNRVRDLAGYDATFWLDGVPEELRVAGADDTILTVAYEPRVLPPELPAELTGWLEPEEVADYLAGNPQLAGRGFVDRETWGPDGIQVGRAEVAREDALEVTRVYETWLPLWRQWADHETWARPRRELYDGLALEARRLSQQDDTLEAVLAVGLLTWQRAEGERVCRHLVTRRLDIKIDRQSAILTVTVVPGAPSRMEDRDFLDSSDGYAAERTQSVREELNAQDPHPLTQETEQFLRTWHELALDQAIDFRTVLEAPGVAGTAPMLTLSPAIIVRARDRNALVEYYDHIANSLSGPDAAAPLGLAQLLFSLDATERVAWAAASTRAETSPLGDDPLFPLDTNPAQRDVLHRLANDSAVVVQGPPGTGKTHTIANLMSALLAQGQRVLVTSQKDQALRVLRTKLPTPIQDLCVLHTDTRTGGSDELERSITTLSDRAATTNPETLEKEIQRLEDQRRLLRIRRAEAVERIRMLREAEMVEHGEIAPGYSGRLAQIAAKTAAERARYQWLPNGATSLQSPLTVEEALQLRNLLVAATPERTARRTQRIPDPAALPSVQELQQVLAATAEQLLDSGDGNDVLVEELAQPGRRALDELRGYMATGQSALHRLGLPEESSAWNVRMWPASAVTEALARRNARLWEYVTAQALQATPVYQALTAIGPHVVTVPSSGTDAMSLIDAAVDLHEYLQAGGQLRKVLPSRQQRAASLVLGTCRVDGRPPSTVDDVALVLVRLRASAAAATLTRVWAQVERQVPAGDLELQLATFTDWADDLAEVEVLRQARDSADQFLAARGIPFRISTCTDWDRLISCTHAAYARISQHEAEEALNRIDDRLAAFQQATDPAPELWALRAAVQSRDVDAYVQAVQYVRDASLEQQGQRGCDELLGRLQAGHPALADLLARTAADPSWPERLADLSEAWAWLSATWFCEDRRQPGQDRVAQQELDDAEYRLGRVTEDLAAARAWRYCMRRMTQEQRSALQAYKSAMSALGKGTGRHAPRHRRQARDAMLVARDAVPAWVMTLPDVVETLPPEPDSFDVVIVDEASQVGIDAVFLLWLAPRVIVVGDDKQCAPGIIRFGELQRIYDQLDTALPDTPTWMRKGFEPNSNLYELLSATFPEIVRLVEHFRCMPEIIGWSSKQFYNDRLLPLRQFGADRLEPLKVIHVSGAYTDGRDSNIRNELEAKEIVEALLRMIQDPAYHKKSMGVIVLQGMGQVRLIDSMLSEAIDPAERERRKLMVGNPPQFQGDERDVILLSMVVAEPGRALTRLEEQRRFNVAASRARDQLCLFTSVTVDRLKEIDLRRSLLGYMQSPPPANDLVTDIGPVEADTPTRPFESLFEQRVYLRLRQRHYTVAPQVPVEGRRIDLVVVGAERRLAVECDGDAYHTSPDQVRADIERERELRRVGWDFWRVRESDFAFDPGRALEPLWDELERRQIRPDVQITAATPQSSEPWQPAELPEVDADDIEV